MPLLVRTWNVFHGNANPPERRGFLEEMVRLVSSDRPDVLCLQELPVWSLRWLEQWSGMYSFGATAARPLLGSAEIGRLITELHHGVFRSAVAGQANAIMIRRGELRALAKDSIVLNPPSFRRAQSRALGLDRRIQLAWTKERRVCHAVRASVGERFLTVANLHDSSVPDWSVPDAELMRAAVFADSVAEPDDVLVLAGDFNVIRERSKTLGLLTGPEWGFSRPISWIDQILVRGARAGHVKRWPDERRSFEGRLLSDHAPVEVTIE